MSALSKVSGQPNQPAGNPLCKLMSTRSSGLALLKDDGRCPCRRDWSWRVTFALWQNARQDAAQVLEAECQFRVNNIVDRIGRRFDDYPHVLPGTLGRSDTSENEPGRNRRMIAGDAAP